MEQTALASPFDANGPHCRDGTEDLPCHSEAATSSESKTESVPMETTEKVSPEKRLGVVFDIDGTLISQHDDYCGIRIRPGAIDFLRWLKGRGHAAAIWTKASESWAHEVVRKICPLASGPHECIGARCRNTFDFVWSSEKCSVATRPSTYWNRGGNVGLDMEDGCRWCEVYASSCHQCQCAFYASWCPCRCTKELRKVFSATGDGDEDSKTRRFTRERTLIVEDTPQNCRRNYGNAIYVPTYRGAGRCLSEDDVFSKLRCFFESDLEPCNNVRFVRKCDHGRHYHACYRQSWLYG